MVELHGDRRHHTMSFLPLIKRYRHTNNLDPAQQGILYHEAADKPAKTAANIVNDMR